MRDPTKLCRQPCLPAQDVSSQPVHKHYRLLNWLDVSAAAVAGHLCCIAAGDRSSSSLLRSMLGRGSTIGCTHAPLMATRTFFSARMVPAGTACAQKPANEPSARECYRTILSQHNWGCKRMHRCSTDSVELLQWLLLQGSAADARCWCIQIYQPACIQLRSHCHCAAEFTYPDGCCPACGLVQANLAASKAGLRAHTGAATRDGSIPAPLVALMPCEASIIRALVQLSACASTGGLQPTLAGWWCAQLCPDAPVPSC